MVHADAVTDLHGQEFGLIAVAPLTTRRKVARRIRGRGARFDGLDQRVDALDEPLIPILRLAVGRFTH